MDHPPFRLHEGIVGIAVGVVERGGSRVARVAKGGLVLAGLVAVGAVLVMPTTTRLAVNYRVEVHHIPLATKALNFLSRHERYEEIAEAIVAGLDSEKDRVLAVLAWTHRHVPPTPEGWPLVDDHVLNIMTRGYGSADQAADVFTTLATYAGIPAYWRVVVLPRSEIVLSFAKLESRWRVFDASGGRAFYNEQGELAQLEDVTAETLRPGEGPARLATGPMPVPMRAELQMPWPRLRYEATRALNW